MVPKKKFHVKYVEYRISGRRSLVENWYRVRSDAWTDWDLCSLN